MRRVELDSDELCELIVLHRGLAVELVVDRDKGLHLFDFLLLFVVRLLESLQVCPGGLPR